MKKVVQRFYFW